MHFSLKQALTWLVIILCAGIIISGLYQHTSESNTKSETIVATDWKIIKTNIGGSTYSEEDDDYEIGDNIRLNVKVSFDLNGGEISPDFSTSKIVSTNEKYGTLPVPTRIGYNFEGWYTKVIGGTKITEESIVKINRNHTLYAHWNPIQYNVAYYHNNALLGTFPYLYNQDITIKDINEFGIKKTGYTFKGWTDLSDILYTAGSTTSRLTEKENSTFKLYSNWKANEYTVNFDSNGGTTPQNTKTVTYDSAYGALPTPTRQYYTFTGWYTDKENGSKVTENDIYKIDGNSTLYAHWAQNTYTITFIVGDKTYIETAFEGEDVNIPDTSKTGYTFKGWYTKASGGTKIDDFQYKTQTVYAQWQPNTYLLTFDANGGTVSPHNKEVTYDSTYGTLPTPTRTGYTFIGWFFDNDKQLKNTDIVKITSDITVKAKWKANSYTINFYNGSTKLGSKTFTYDKPDLLPQFSSFHIDKTGYTFAGWGLSNSDKKPSYTDGQSIINLADINNANINLYTVWQANKYTVTYISENKVYGTSQFTYDKAEPLLTVKDLALEKAGYQFEGWTTEEGSTTVKYKDGETVKNLVTTPDGNKNLYAVWKAKEYTVNYYNGTQKVGSSIHVYDKDSNLKTIAELNLSKTGYTFQGWSISPTDLKVTFKDGAPVKNLSIGTAIDLYAVWTPNTYTVTLDSAGGTVNPTIIKVTYDQSYGELPTPSRTGYTFKGWYLGSTKITKDSIVKITSNSTLVAKWEANKYTVVFEANGGNVDVISKEVIYDGTFGILPTPTRTGYSFNGWYLGEQHITSSTIVKITSNVTLTARWSANTYTVEYYSDGYKKGSSLHTFDKESNLATLAALKISKPGYTFKGWATNSETMTPVYNDGQNIENLTNGNGTVIKLYAVWDANSYTVEYYDNGTLVGSSSHVYDIAKNLTTSSSLNIKKTGYTFKGWALTEGATTAKYTDGASIKNLTTSFNGTVKLYSVWQANTYKIEYYSLGQLKGSSSHIYDTAKNLTSAATLGLNNPGYTFKGWALTNGSTTVKYQNSQSVINLTSSTNGVVKLYAVWQANAYTVALDPAGGTVNPTSIKVTYDKAYGTLPTPTRSGYTFNGWFLDDTQITKDSIVKITRDSTLVAKWTANKYTINFDANGGTVGTTTKEVTYDSLYGILPVPTYEGYGFSGWYLGNELITKDSIVKITSNSTLIAKWNVNKYTIEYYDNGTLVGSSIHAFNNKQALKTDVDLGIKRTGYSLAGWSETADSTKVIYKNGEEVLNLTSTNNAVVKLYSVWTANTYTITFNPNGGTGGPTEQNFKFNGGEKITTSIPSRTGYTFNQWVAHHNTQYTFKPGATIPNGWGSFTLDAQWTANNYNVEYYNGTTKVGTSTHVYDTNKNLTSASTLKLAKTGYTFSGWALTDGGTKKYNDGATVKNLTATNGGTVKLYALWTANQYTVTFDPAGGTVSPTTKQVTYNSTYGTLPTPSRDGYTFAGWHLGNTQIIEGTKVTSTSNHTLTAHWTEHQATKYTVKHYLMNVNGVGYTLKDTDNLTGPTDNNIIIKDHAKTYTGFTYNSCKLDGSSTATSSDTTTILGDGSRVLNLYYTRNKYTITVVKGTGVASASVAFTQYYQSNVSVTATASSGYSWNKWTSSNTSLLADSTNATYGFTIPAGNVTLTATATANTYTIEYYSDGVKSGSSTHTYNTAKNLTSLVNLGIKKQGYTFQGWSTTSGGTTITYGDGASVKNLSATKGGVVKLYAVWTANDQLLTINPNGGRYDNTTANTKITGKTDSHINIQVPTRTGYRFNQWTKSGPGTITYDTNNKGIFTFGAGGTTLTAKWLANTYTIEYYNGNTKVGSSNHTYDTAKNLTSASALKIYKTGYVFNGWKTSASASTATYGDEASVKNLTATHSGVVKLYALWKPNATTQFNVKHYLMNTDGTTYTLNSTQSYTGTSDSSITLSSYRKSFTGFTYKETKLDNSSTATNSDTTTIAPNGSRVIHIYYSRNQYTITVNKGTGINTVTSNFTKYYGTSASVTTTLTTGYSWVNWTSSNTGLLANSTAQTYSFTMPAGNVILTANARANTYTVEYYSDSAKKGSSSHTYNTAKNLTTASALGLTKSGYAFAGWSTTSGGTTVNYADGASIKNLTATQGTVIKLYAVWRSNTQTLTINPNGGTYNSSTNNTQINGTTDSTISINVPTKTGYRFNQWTLTGAGKITYDATNKGTFTFGASQTTLTANWIANNYTVNYYNGNTKVGSSSHTYNSAKSLTTTSVLNLNKTGYTFAGWSTTSGGTTVNYTDGASVNNLTSTHNGTVNLYAIWRANTSTSYSVNHYLMNTDGATYALNSTQKYTGTSDATITLSAYRKTFTGFTYKETKLNNASSTTSSTTTTISPDGSRIINIYYSRNKYQITVAKGTGITSVTDTFTAYYGTSAYVTSTSATGYHWNKWISSNTSLLPDGPKQTYAFTVPAGNVILTATATANTYTVKYYNGTTLLGSSNHTYNTSKKLTSGAALKAVKSGYDFVGWDTSKSGNTVKLDDEQNVTNLKNTNDAVIELYAVFSDIAKQIEDTKNTFNFAIGTVIQTTNSTNPSSLYGGIWQQIATDRILVGLDENDSDFNTIRKTGGTKTENITIDTMPRHSHTGTTNNAGNHSHSFNSNTAQTYGVAYSTSDTSAGNPYIPASHSKDHLKEGYHGIYDAGNHSHSFTTNNTGGSTAHNNMQPYYGVYTWEKVGN